MDWERIENVIQCERGIAGAVLLSPKETVTAIRSIISADDFTDGNARAVYEAAVKLIDNKSLCDANIIQVESGVSTEYCRAAMIDSPTAVNAPEYARIVHDAAQQRRAKDIGSDLADGAIDAISALAKLQELFQTQSGRIITPQEQAQSAMDVFSAAADGSLTPFLKTGYKSIDSMLSGGLANGGLITVAARPGTGKTTLGICIAENVAAAGRTVLYVSLEMTSTQLWACRAANAAGIDRSEILSGSIIKKGSAPNKTMQDELNAKRLYDAYEVLYNRPFYIHDKPAGIEDIERKARCINELALIVVDHIGLVKNPGRASRYEFMTSVSHQLKQLALSMKIPVLALCQLNRASVQRSRPTMSDLRDSGAIEEDSDVVCLLYRDMQPGAIWEPIQLIFDKNRHGTTGQLELGYCGMYSRIAENKMI